MAPGQGMDLKRQLAIISDFGGRALRTDDLDALLQEAAALVAEALDAPQAKVLELLPDGDALLVRSGVGWHPDVVGKATIDAHLGSPAGYALHTGEPAISADLTIESRFEIPPLLVEHGIRSMVNVIIRGEGPPFGVLEVDSPELREFSADDVHFLQSYANLLAAAVERLTATRALRQAAADRAAAAEEREVLLRELQHRVKNNLQMIVSLIQLQRQRAGTPESARQLEALAKRVHVLSRLHDKLHGTDRGGQLALGSYLEELCESLREFFDLDARGVRCVRRFSDVQAPADTALHLSLIVNEFISNSVEHAFPDRRGTITVALERVAPDRARLLLADDGVGLPENRDGGLGLQLIETLARQVVADLEWDTGNGTRAILIFPA